jgi:Fatty acid hydroxylase superfamily
MVMLETLTRLAFTYVLLSFFEYAGHRWLLHKVRLARRCQSKWLERMCLNHMGLHHKKPYRHESHEQDDDPLQLVVAGTAVGLVVAVPIYFFVDHLTVEMLAGFGPLYAVTMYVFHKQMHLRADGPPFRWPLLSWLDKRHRLHHQHPNHNMNVILPLFDWIFGTAAVA